MAKNLEDDHSDLDETPGVITVQAGRLGLNKHGEGCNCHACRVNVTDLPTDIPDPYE